MMVPKVFYKVYKIERGLLVEPEQHGHSVYDGYDSMEDAVEAVGVRLNGDVVILPTVFMVLGEEVVSDE